MAAPGAAGEAGGDVRGHTVILASDRGPVTFTPGIHGLVAGPRQGSVTTLLDAAARSLPGTATAWFALSVSPHDRDALAAGMFAHWSAAAGYRYEPVAVGEAEYHGYYAEAGARLLWMAHHDLWPDLGCPGPGAPRGTKCPLPVPPRPDAFTGAYQRVNQRVARKIAASATPGTLAVLHDYQLATVPGFLRALLPGLPVAHFTHTPFATPGAFARLPGSVSGDLLAGMLGADLLGFQCREWAEDFLACCEWAGYRVDRHDGRIDQSSRATYVRCYPVPVDAAALAAESASPGVLARERRLPLGAVTVVRVERADPAKNAVRGIQAFGRLLADSPALAATTRLIAHLVPSRPYVPEYRAYAEDVHAAVAEVTSAFPGSIHLYLGEDRRRALAALRAYDVLFVSPVRDGMNLVALEGPVINARDGVLVLSRGAGAASVLGDGAVVIGDPRDVTATAAALRAAVTMPPEERRRRAGRLRAQAGAGGPAGWLAAQVRDLAAITGRAAGS